MSNGCAMSLDDACARCVAASLRLVERPQEQRELVAAEPGDQIGLARASPQRRADASHQHLVADGVAERVVDRLEVVEIDAEHRDRLAALGCAALDLVHLRRAEQRAVGQVGQRVVPRQMPDARFGAGAAR